ncbi:hypothetical protein [Sediminibacterium ginsengisoli]|uniref:Uncharacterized protein n=1 Tax=Sediminibacterium ginsengisoli TaxID=413434 RepID=A0A1T4P2P3_9BACT|nr:hypothetical protein [Sediminibacterium ginsengisoli]SJZ85536.1 hypothetical protein SAMN04488132_105103 [Sediminibacterium ginsengisoli]
MSYLDSLPEKELAKYEIVNNLYNLLSIALQPGAKRKISYKIIREEFDLTQSHNTEIFFHNCIFLEKVMIRKATFEHDLGFHDCFFDKDFAIGNEVNCKKSFGVINCKFKTTFVSIDAEYGDCYFKIRECNDFMIKGLTFRSMIMEYEGVHKLNQVSLSDLNEFTEGEMRLQSLVADNFNLTGSSKKMNYYIENLFVKKLNIDEYRNDGILRLTDINALNPNVETEFIISDSYLGRAEFNDIDFSSFSHLYIGDSRIIDCSFTNVTWSKSIGAFDYFQKHISDTETKIKDIEKPGFLQLFKTARLRTHNDVISYYGKQREIYRQLKYAMAKQGDVVNEQHFHALEMEAYDKSLLWSKSRWTKMILKLSRWTSDYGQSVIKPIIWLFTVHFILFSILVYNNYFPNLQFSTQPNWQGFKDGINYYFETINPFRKTESGLSFVVIDLTMRIWSSYMIYNFIRASRRFIK